MYGLKKLRFGAFLRFVLCYGVALVIREACEKAEHSRCLSYFLMQVTITLILEHNSKNLDNGLIIQESL